MNGTVANPASLPFAPRREAPGSGACGCPQGNGAGSAVCVPGTRGDLPVPGPVVMYSPGSANIGTTPCS